MAISEQSLDAFIDAYERANGERLTREDALDAVHRVLAFVKLLSTPPVESVAQTDAPSA